MATKRSESNALQIRITDAELAQLDGWVTALQDRPGGSGVSRTTILRDLLISELVARDEASAFVQRAKALRKALPVSERINEAADEKEKLWLRDALPVLQWIATSRLESATSARRIVEQMTSPSQTFSRNAVTNLSVSTYATLGSLIHDAEMRYGRMPQTEP